MEEPKPVHDSLEKDWNNKTVVGVMLIITAIMLIVAHFQRKENNHLETFSFIDSTEFYKYVQEQNVRFNNQQEQYKRLLEQSQQKVIESIQERNSINNNRPNAQTTLDYIDRISDANRHSVAQSIIRHLDSLNAKGSEIVRGYPEGKFKRN